MVLKGKIVAEIEVRSSADVFHELFGTKPHHVSNFTPQHIQGCKLHEGEFGKPGSVVVWNYSINGKPCIAKEKVEAIDEENKSVTFRVIEGDLLQDFKTFIIHIHVIPEEGGLDKLKWTVEYERIHEDAAFPTPILELIFNVTKDIEKHHRTT